MHPARALQAATITLMHSLMNTRQPCQQGPFCKSHEDEAAFPEDSQQTRLLLLDFQEHLSSSEPAVQNSLLICTQSPSAQLVSHVPLLSSAQLCLNLCLGNTCCKNWT